MCCIRFGSFIFYASPLYFRALTGVWHLLSKHVLYSIYSASALVKTPHIVFLTRLPPYLSLWYMLI